MSALEKIKEFEKASKVKQLSMEEQRQKARFEHRKNKFENETFGQQNNNGRKTSDVLRKAQDFMDVNAAAEREKEAKARKESFDKTRQGFAKIEKGQSIDDTVDEDPGNGLVQASVVVFEPDPNAEAKAEQARLEEEEAEKRKIEFKNKAMMFASSS